MKIDTLAASVIQPLRRKKKRSPKIPPWASELPPDKVEILLRAHVNRYSRSKLRYNHFGSTRTKYQQRMAIYKDLLDIHPEHVLSIEEMIEELVKLRQESIQKEQEQNIASTTSNKVDAQETDQKKVNLDDVTDSSFERMEDDENYRDGDFTLESMIKNALTNG